MFGDKPHWLFRRHPAQSIETREVYRARVAPQRPFKSQVEINIEVAHRQFPQRAINRLAITTASEIRFRNRAPMPAHFENRDHMICVLLSFQIENQWRKSQNAEGGRGEDGSFETRRGPSMKNFFRRMRGVSEIVGDLVEEALDACGRFQRAKFAQL